MNAEIQPIAEGLWTLDQPFRAGPVELGIRTNLVRVPSGLLLHAPGPLAPGLREQIAALGDVSIGVAPNSLHHLYLRDFQREFPEARVFAAAGVAAKQPDLELQAELSDRADELWAGELDQLHVRGTRMNEVVFLHRSSRTLLLTDLAFNIRSRARLLDRLFLGINRVYGRFGPSRIMQHVMIQDRHAFKQSFEQIMAWDFDRVLVSHGEVLESGGRQALGDAYAHILKGVS